MPPDAAIHQLVRRFTSRVCSRLRQLGVHPAELDDATQDVFIVASRKLDGFEGRSTLKTWLFGICAKVAADHRRKATRRSEAQSSIAQTLAVEPDVVDCLISAQTRRDVSSVVQLVTEPQRTTLVLFELEERPMAEVAARTGVPQQTAYARLYSARRQVRRVWSRRAGDFDELAS